MSRIELLSPAGGQQALIAAVQSGADAVYLGGSRFSARQSAENFTSEEFQKQVDYCHLYGVKVYAAVNTLIKDQETQEFKEFAKELSDAGVDGVIIQDLGAVQIFKAVAPDLPLHGSTQMTVTSLDGVRFLEELGFRRVVLARELSRKEIAFICRHAKAEIEVFVHGALCMCYSGQCLMSSIIGGRSGNRGRCAQPCRLPYQAIESGHGRADGYLLSPKDLSLIDELEALKQIGVASLKIEGRLKRPEYVSAVTGLYRKYLDYPGAVSDADRQELKDAFHRGGFSKAYFAGETGKTMMSHDDPGNQSANRFTPEAVKRAQGKEIFRKIPVSIHGNLKIGKPLTIEMCDSDGNRIFLTGTEPAEYAENKPVTAELLERLLKKVGGTVFTAVQVTAQTDGISVLPAAAVNALRRQAVEALMNKRMENPKRQTVLLDQKQKRQTNPKTVPLLTAEVYTKEQRDTARKHGISRIYVSPELDDGGADLIVSLNKIDQGKQTDPTGECVEVWNLGQLYRCKGQGHTLYGGHRLNVMNAYTADFFKDLALVTVSPELNLQEIRNLASYTETPLEVIAYGRLTLMITANCPLKAAGTCQKGREGMSLSDRKHREFPVLCKPDCRPELLNAVPIYMADKAEDLKSLKVDALRLIFTVENSTQCDKIINEYQKALSGEALAKPEENTFTRGHFYRGVQ